MNEFKKDLACNITLIGVLTATFIYTLILSLNLFGAVTLPLPKYFNYILAYALIIISLAIYILGFFITQKHGFEFPKWLRIMFYIAFFVFTNVYYFAGWFNSIFAIIVLFAYLGFCISILSLSIFYNAQKDDKNRLKSTRKFIITSVFMYSIASEFILLFVIETFKALFFNASPMSTLSVFAIESTALIFATIITTICFYMSLLKTKTMINACLLKYNKPEVKLKSVKNV